MSAKASKHNAKMKLKRAAKASKKAKYEALAGTSKKAKRQNNRKKVASPLKHAHVMSNCGNLGCKKCQSQLTGGAPEFPEVKFPKKALLAQPY